MTKLYVSAAEAGILGTSLGVNFATCGYSPGILAKGIVDESEEHEGLTVEELAKISIDRLSRDPMYYSQPMDVKLEETLTQAENLVQQAREDIVTAARNRVNRTKRRFELGGREYPEPERLSPAQGQSSQAHLENVEMVGQDYVHPVPYGPKSDRPPGSTYSNEPLTDFLDRYIPDWQELDGEALWDELRTIRQQFEFEINSTEYDHVRINPDHSLDPENYELLDYIGEWVGGSNIGHWTVRYYNIGTAAFKLDDREYPDPQSLIHENPDYDFDSYKQALAEIRETGFEPTALHAAGRGRTPEGTKRGVTDEIEPAADFMDRYIPDWRGMKLNQRMDELKAIRRQFSFELFWSDENQYVWPDVGIISYGRPVEVNAVRYYPAGTAAFQLGGREYPEPQELRSSDINTAERRGRAIDETMSIPNVPGPQYGYPHNPIQNEPLTDFLDRYIPDWFEMLRQAGPDGVRQYQNEIVHLAGEFLFNTYHDADRDWQEIPYTPWILSSPEPGVHAQVQIYDPDSGYEGPWPNAVSYFPPGTAAFTVSDLTPDQEELIEIINEEIAQRTRYGRRHETVEERNAQVLEWDNSSASWYISKPFAMENAEAAKDLPTWEQRAGLFFKRAKIGQTVDLDANQILVYARRAELESILNWLAPLPLYGGSYEAKERNIYSPRIHGRGMGLSDKELDDLGIPSDNWSKFRFAKFEYPEPIEQPRGDQRQKEALDELMDEEWGTLGNAEIGFGTVERGRLGVVSKRPPQVEPLTDFLDRYIPDWRELDFETLNEELWGIRQQFQFQLTYNPDKDWELVEIGPAKNSQWAKDTEGFGKAGWAGPDTGPHGYSMWNGIRYFMPGTAAFAVRSHFAENARWRLMVYKDGQLVDNQIVTAPDPASAIRKGRAAYPTPEYKIYVEYPGSVAFEVPISRLSETRITPVEDIQLLDRLHKSPVRRVDIPTDNQVRTYLTQMRSLARKYPDISFVLELIDEAENAWYQNDQVTFVMSSETALSNIHGYLAPEYVFPLNPGDSMIGPHEASRFFTIQGSQRDCGLAARPATAQSRTRKPVYDGELVKTLNLSTNKGREYDIQFWLLAPTERNVDTLIKTADRWEDAAIKLLETGKLSREQLARLEFAFTVAFLAAKTLTENICCVLVAYSPELKDAVGITIFHEFQDRSALLSLVTVSPSLQPGLPVPEQIRGVGTSMTCIASEHMIAAGATSICLKPLDRQAEEFWRNRGFKPNKGELCVINNLQSLVAACQREPDCPDKGDCAMLTSATEVKPVTKSRNRSRFRR